MRLCEISLGMFGFDMKNLLLLADIIGHNWIETGILPVGICSPRKTWRRPNVAPTGRLALQFGSALVQISKRMVLKMPGGKSVFSSWKRRNGIIFIHLLSQLHLNLAPAHSAEKIAPDQNILMIKPAWCIDKIGWKILLQYGTWKTMLYHEQLIPCSYKCSLTKNNQGNALSRRACSVMQNANNSSTIIQSIPSMIWVKMYEYSLSQKKTWSTFVPLMYLHRLCAEAVDNVPERLTPTTLGISAERRWSVI